MDVPKSILVNETSANNEYLVIFYLMTLSWTLAHKDVEPSRYG